MSFKKKPAVVTFAELCRQNTAPVLRADSNWVKEDGPLAAKGNVLKALTHPGAPFGSFADRADTDANHNVLKVTTAGTYLGKYGTLVIKANGTYTYTLYSNADKPAAFVKVQGLSDGETLTESFKYKATDGFVTKGSTLKITIFGTDDPVTITNLTPKADGGDTAVDEDGLTGAIGDSSPLGSGETDGNELSANTGDFKISAPDGLKDLLVGGATVISGGIFVGPVTITTPLGSTLVVTAFNPTTGVVTYSYTLNGAVAHPGPGEDSIFESFAVKLTDVDGSSATASLEVQIVDDQPTIAVCDCQCEDRSEVARVVVDECVPPGSLIVDESDLGTDATSNFAGIFIGNFGADGPGTITFALDTAGGPTGLVDTLSGIAVVASLEAGELVGRAGPGGLVVFVISVDSATGAVTFDQQRAVVHDPNFGPDDFEGLPFDLVKVVATITDADGDTASATLDAGNLFGIYDAAPAAQDEPVQAVAEGGTISGTFDFTPGADGATVTAINGTALVFGADGFSQVIDLGAGSINVKADGSYVFTADNPTNNPVSVPGSFTVTDGDGDPATGNFAFTITDANGPTPGTASAAVDDDGLTSPAGNPLSNSGDLDANAGDEPADISEATFTGTLGGSVGLDVPGVFSFAGLDGQTVTVGLETASLSWSGNTLTATGPRGVLFRVEITDPATGAYKVTLVDNVLHSGGPNGEEIDASAALQYTITDSDNTSVNGTLTIAFDDDAPTVALDFATTGESNLDETSSTSTAPTINIGAIIAGDDPDVALTGAIATATSAGPVVVPTIDFGADGPAATGSIVYGLFVGGVAPGLSVTDGSPIALVSVSSTVVAGVVSGGAFDGQAAFAIEIDPLTGIVKVEQYLSLDHPLNPDPDDVLDIADFALTATITVTDGDNDVASAGYTIGDKIKFFDDGLVAVDDTDTIAPGTSGPATGNVLTGIDIAGGDANISDGVADTIGADGGLALTAITGFGGSGSVGGITAGQYGNLTINADGSYSYTRNPNTPGGVTDTFTYTVTDGDGDTDTATLTITIEDARPVTAPNALAQLDDDAVTGAGGNPDGIGDDPDAVNLTGTLSASGGDGPLTWAITSVSIGGGLTGLSANFVNAGLVIISQFGVPIVSLAINAATGAYTLTQLAPIQHEAGSDENNSPWSFGYKVTDQDGDFAVGSLSASFDDDTPVAHSVINPNLTDDEGKGVFAAISNEGETTPLGTDADVAGSPATATGPAGTLFSIGADGLQSIVITGPAGVQAIYKLASGLPAQESLIYSSVTDGSGNVTLTATGAVSGSTAFTLKINADASYTFTQSAALVHPLFNPSNEDDLPLAFNFTVTDKDGDPASGSLTITVDDDTPVGGAVVADVNEVSTQTNLMLIVDISGSMGEPSGIAGLTRIEAARQAMVDLINAYDANGDVVVRIVTFSSGATELGSAWMSAAAAITAINGLADDNGVTNYDAAIAAAQGAFPDPGKIAGGQNVSYFLSDGIPNPASTGLDAGEEALWEGFLDPNNIVSFALGMGTGLTTAALDPVAFNGVTGVDTGAVIVDDFADLSGVLVGTAAPTLVSGTVPGSFGADGGSFALTNTGAPSGFTYEVSGNTLLVKQAGTTVLTLTIDPVTGAYTVKQNSTIDHPGAGADVLPFVFTVALTDGDKDGATSTITLNVKDGVPTATSVTAGTLDDDSRAGGLAGGSGDFDPTLATLSGSLGTTYGSDGPGSISFAALNGTTQVVNGVTVTYSWNAGTSTLTANDGEQNVFEVVVNQTSGSYTINLLNSLDHHTNALADNVETDATFTLGYTVTDGDTDTAAGSLTFTIDDDTPINLTPDAEVLTNVAGASSSSSLPLPRLDSDANIDNNVGADQLGSIAFANITNGQQATGVIDGSTVNLTSGGKLIKLYLADHDASATTPLQLQGWTDFGLGTATQIFTATLLPDGSLGTSNDRYSVSVLKAIDNGSGVVFTNLTGTGPAGNVSFKIVDSDATDNNGSLELLLTPGDRSSNTDATGGTINSDADDIGISDQWIDPSPDVLRIDYGQFSIVSNQYQIDSHTTVNGARYQLVQTGGPDTNEMMINFRAYDADDDETVSGDAGDAADTINRVRVFASDGTTLLVERTLAEGDGAESGFTFDFQGNGSVTVTDLVEGQFVAVDTSTGFNRIEIDNVTSPAQSNDQFSVGGLAVETTLTGKPIDLTYDLALTDGDGDKITIVGAIDITLQAVA